MNSAIEAARLRVRIPGRRRVVPRAVRCEPVAIPLILAVEPDFVENLWAVAPQSKRKWRRTPRDESGWSPRLPSSRVLRRRESSPGNADSRPGATPRVRPFLAPPKRRRPANRRPLPRSETEPAGGSTIEAARLRGPQNPGAGVQHPARGTPRTGHHPAGVPAGTGTLAERPAAALRGKGRRRRIPLDESAWSPRLPNSRVLRRRESSQGNADSRPGAISRVRPFLAPPTRRRPANRRPLPRSETEPAGGSTIEAARLRGPQNPGAGVQHPARGTPRTGHHPAGVPAGTGTLAERPAAALRGKGRRRRIPLDESAWSPRLPNSRVPRRRGIEPE